MSYSPVTFGAGERKVVRVAKEISRNVENGNLSDARAALAELPPLSAAVVGALLLNECSKDERALMLDRLLRWSAL